MRYYFDRLNSLEKKAYTRIKDAIEKHEDAMDVFRPSVSIASLESIVKAISYDCPELFFVDFTKTNFYESGMKITVCPQYIYNKMMLPRAAELIDERVKSILDDITRNNYSSDYDKALWLHDYFIQHTTYDHTEALGARVNKASHSAAGVLLENKAVCEGIAKAFTLLLGRLNIHAITVYGRSNSPIASVEDHAWNTVKLGGKFYHVDMTWDITLSKSFNQIRHDYFCLDDTEISKDHFFKNIGITCESLELNYYKKTERYIKGKKHLNEFLKGQILKGEKNICFKVMRSPNVGENINAVVQDTLETAVSNYMVGSYQYTITPNDSQLVYGINFCTN